MKKITTKIGIKDVFLEEGTPEIRDAGDILEILDYPDKGSSLVLISVQEKNEHDYCSTCDIPRCNKGKERLCIFTKFRCTASKTGVNLKRIDTMLESL